MNYEPKLLRDYESFHYRSHNSLSLHFSWKIMRLKVERNLYLFSLDSKNKIIERISNTCPKRYILSTFFMYFWVIIEFKGILWTFLFVKAKDGLAKLIYVYMLNLKWFWRRKRDLSQIWAYILKVWRRSEISSWGKGKDEKQECQNESPENKL